MFLIIGKMIGLQYFAKAGSFYKRMIKYYFQNNPFLILLFGCYQTISCIAHVPNFFILPNYLDTKSTYNCTHFTEKSSNFFEARKVISHLNLSREQKKKVWPPLIYDLLY